MTSFFFRRVQPLRLHLAEGVSVGELVQALSGSLLTLSNHPNGGIVIHRFQPGVDRTRPTIPCDGPPQPPRAA